MSGLTKKVIWTDATLSTILGVNEGSLVSYSDLLKGLHRYIKEKNLKKPTANSSTAPPSEPTAADTSMTCRDCGEPIPSGAIFCDMCGVRQ
jgi:chromatin remodeling complex protein RSC6